MQNTAERILCDNILSTFNLHVSWFAKRIQHDKQTFEVTGVSIRILLEKVF